MRGGAFIVAVALSLASHGCFTDTGTVDEDGGEVSTASSTGPQGPCTPGEQANCDCPGAPGAGVQVCRDDGAGFGSCECGGTDTGDASTGVVDDGTSTGGTTSSEGSTGASTTTGPGTKAVELFVRRQSVTGDLVAEAGMGLGARDSANALCEQAANAPAACTSFVAVISIDAADLLVDLAVPTDVEVVGPNGVVAASWTDMVSLTVGLVMSLSDAGVTGLGFWTGTDLGGGLAANCGGWTTAGGATGRTGDPSAIDGTWMDGGNSPMCDMVRGLLCACW